MKIDLLKRSHKYIKKRKPIDFNIDEDEENEDFKSNTKSSTASRKFAKGGILILRRQDF